MTLPSRLEQAVRPLVRAKSLGSAARGDKVGRTARGPTAAVFHRCASPATESLFRGPATGCPLGECGPYNATLAWHRSWRMALE